MKDKLNTIDEMKIRIDNVLKENNQLLFDLEGSQNLKESLSNEKSRTKEVETKVEELAGFILSRDETIKQLKFEVKRNLEDSDAFRNDSNKTIALQNEESNTLKQEISIKVIRSLVFCVCGKHLAKLCCRNN